MVDFVKYRSESLKRTFYFKAISAAYSFSGEEKGATTGGGTETSPWIFSTNYIKKLNAEDYGPRFRAIFSSMGISPRDVSEIVDSAEDDQQIFSKIAAIYQKKEGTFDRGLNRATRLYSKFKVPVSAATKYLDFGVFDGAITRRIADVYGVPKGNVYGIDIVQRNIPGIKCDIVGETSSGGVQLPYIDGYFSFVTCLMVLHHVPQSRLIQTVEELFRIMAPGGHIILREHDCEDESLVTVLNLLHKFYDAVFEPQNRWVECTSAGNNSGVCYNPACQELMCAVNYMSVRSLRQIMTSAGFVETNFAYNRNTKHNPFNRYDIVFIKPNSDGRKPNSDGRKPTGDPALGGDPDSDPAKFITSQYAGIIDAIREISDQKHAFVYKYQDLPELKYTPQSGVLNMNIHIGQRKLLLTEIEFYSRFKGEGIVVYAGSANGLHTPVILEMFPKLKFIYIDPNYHVFRDSFHYVYQNTELIAPDNLKLVRKTCRHLDRVPFLYGGVADILASAEHYIKTKSDLAIITKSKTLFKQRYKTLVDDLCQSKSRVFIIQDYMTEDLASKIKEAFDFSKKEFNFLTDIRTNVRDTTPHDIDVLWNYALQILFIKTMRPACSMLKFRPPYFEEQKKSDFTEQFKQVVAGKHDEENKYAFIMKIMAADLAKVKELYGLDMFGEYVQGKFSYFDGEDIFIQPWAPIGSTETRLFVRLDEIDKPWKTYSHLTWENKFFYMRFINMYGYYEKFQLKSKSEGYDKCYNCNRELMILYDYYESMGHTVYPSAEKCVSSMSRNISRFTGGELSVMSKSAWHGVMSEKPKEYILNIELKSSIIGCLLKPNSINIEYTYESPRSNYIRDKSHRVKMLNQFTIDRNPWRLKKK